MPGVGGDALSWEAGVHSALPTLGITSVFVPQPAEEVAETLVGLRDTFLSGCWGSQVGKPSASLRHNKEMKLLQGHADLMKAGFGFPCTLWKRTLSHISVHAWVKCVQDRRPLFPLLVLHTARLQDTFHGQQEQSQRDLFPVQQLPAASHMKKCPCSLYSSST